MRIPILIVLLLLLILTASASANYTVRIESEECVCLASSFYAFITIEPDDPGNETLLGGFDLTISYDQMHLAPIGVDEGSFLSQCGDSCSGNCAWEYFTYRLKWDYAGCCPTCGDVGTVEVIALVDLNNGQSVDASCFEPLHKDTLAVVSFQTSVNNNLDGVFSPIDFYWRPDASNPCAENTFSDKTGDTLLYTNSVVDAEGEPFDTSYYCSGPPSSCSPTGVLYALDFHGGGVTLGANERGDLNLNGMSYEISDATKYADYFIYGPGGFFFPDSADSARQVANSEVNCDGLPLTIGDLVYLIRVITGDAEPSDSCPPCPRCADPAPQRREDFDMAASIDDTLMVRDRSADPGDERVPFYVHAANSVDIAAIQARMVFDTAHLTPHFDTAIGDGESVEFNVMGRAWNYENHGQVRVKSYEPGVILITFLPDLDTLPTISAGSGNILTVRMDVKSTATICETSDVEFVTEGFYYNLFSDMDGFAIWPELVAGEFEVDCDILPPSCPVLFSYDGNDYVQNDPLLTACEESGYRDVVTDYYLLPQGVPAPNGKVRFQLREMEDEVTFLDEIELITVDHSPATRVAAGADGHIVAYSDQTAPASAVDHHGVDRLAQVSDMDGVLYSSREAGHLVITFPNSRDAVKGYNFPTALKAKQCRLKASPDGPDGFDPLGGNRVTIEIFDNNGIWRELPTPPMRQSAQQASVVSSLAGDIESDFITVRISWDGYYTVDAVSQFVPADETPMVTTWPVSDSELRSLTNVSEAGVNSTKRLVLNMGDILDFSFDTDQLPAGGMTRDYVIKAVGRYQPDYSVHTNLVPNDFMLYDNYPNPFNPATNIAFDLPATAHVKLEIINTLGQTVTTLVDSEMGAGHHEVQWVSSSSHASGVYFYRLTTSEFEQTKKMVLMK